MSTKGWLEGENDCPAGTTASWGGGCCAFCRGRPPQLLGPPWHRKVTYPEAAVSEPGRLLSHCWAMSPKSDKRIKE